LQSIPVVLRPTPPPAPPALAPPELAPPSDRSGERPTGFSTKVSDRASPVASTLYTRIRPVGLVERINIETSADGSVCPTLVVGLGGAGVKFAEKLRQKRAARYTIGDVSPPVRMLGLDTDEQSLAASEGGERLSPEAYEQFVSCRLNRPVHYLRKWDECKHLSSWLDNNYVFEISSSGSTNGPRPLGRLALFEHYRRIALRLKAELDSLLAPVAMAEYLDAAGVKLRRKRPRVYVVSSMGGGTGSGMFLDICYLLRHILNDVGETHPDVQGLLLAGLARGDRGRELQRVNHYALAQDLLTYTQPNAEFRLQLDPTVEPIVFREPPVEAVYFVDSTGEPTAEPNDDLVLDSGVEFVLQSALSRLGAAVDEQAKESSWPMFRGLGWFSLVFPRRRLYRQAAAHIDLAMVDRWMESTVGGVKKSDVDAESARRLDPNLLAKRLLEEADRRLPSPIQ
ncbi:MAG: tubulin-like doman-containing protein, partial [Planctomycetia bacterium]